MGVSKFPLSPRRGRGLPEAVPVSASKISRPILAGCYARKRLFRLMDASRGRSAVWVSGPPGSGKTTFVSSYVEERELPCIWYEVDEGDSDPATFFYCLGLAARRAAPRYRTPLPLLTFDRFPSLSSFARGYFEALYLRLKSRSVIVFDNYHRIPADSPLHGVIRDAVARLPEGMNIVLVGRGDPPPPFARLRAGRQLADIGWESLRLSLEETGGIARQRAEEARSAESVRFLHAKAAGWAAGLVLLLETGPAGSVPAGRPGRRTSEEIFDYFAGEVFGKLDVRKRDFLVRTSFLPRMTASVAERLTGEIRSRRLLSSLNRENLFTAKHTDVEPVFRYHSLFREFLQRVAEDTLPPEEVARLRKTAASVQEEAGQLEDAAFLMREAGDVDGLARVVLKLAGPLIEQGRSRTLLEWMSAIPQEKIEGDPWLLYWLGACVLPFHPPGSRLRFESAFRLFERLGDARGSFLAWSGAVDAIVYGPEGLKPLDPWFAELERLGKRHGGIPPGKWRRGSRAR